MNIKLLILQLLHVVAPIVVYFPSCVSGKRSSSSLPYPPSFDCLMRKAAYEYGKKLIPRHGAFSALYYALDLAGEDCHEEMKSTPNPSRPREEGVVAEKKKKRRLLHANEEENDPEIVVPSNAVYVSLTNGDDDHHIPNGAAATIRATSSKTSTTRRKKPFRSIQKALDYAAQQAEVSHVILREGVYYLNNTLFLTSRHSHLTLAAYPGEEVILSGGKPLLIDHWEPYKTDGDNNIWVTHLGQQQQLQEFPGLQINGIRSTRARYPNIPGGIEVSCGYGCMIDARVANWTPPITDKFGPPTYYTDNTTIHTRSNGGWFEQYTIGIHGLCDVYDPPVSYWCSKHPSGGGARPFRTPSGLTPFNKSNPTEKVLPNGPYKNIDDAIIFVWRPARWANWMFTIKDYDKNNGNMTFGQGGNQGARGSGRGGDWFIENVMEELDYPNEYYYDKKTQKLYLFYNGTGSPPLDATFVVPQLRTLINISATQWDPAQNVTIRGLTFRSTRFTYMDAHGVPSGGDWALERNGAVFLQGTEGTTIDQCTFDRLDGNGLMISGYNRHTTVADDDFSYLGGTAIASWGYTNETDTDPGRPGILLENAPAAGVDGTDGEHPRYNSILGCTAREVGLYEKQASFYMQAKTAYTIIKGNVFFNGPRAGINFNDGFGGGDELANNLVFSTCRESGDHGPFNSWDRQPFFTLKDGDDQPSMGMEWRNIHHNFFVDNYSPQEAVDNDDGSRYFHTHDNFLVYGKYGMKNDFGGHDNQAMAICDQLEGKEDHFVANRVVLTGKIVGAFKCGGPGAPIMHDNQYYTNTGTVEECKMPLEEWQKQGHDPNSTVAKYPTDEEIIQWAKSLLDF